MPPFTDVSDQDTDQDSVCGLRQSTVTLLGALSMLAMAASVSFYVFGLESALGLHGVAAGDFDVFHTVGVLAQDGRLTEAYSHEAFLAAQSELNGTVHDMTWTYPPVFNLLLLPLADLSRPAAYLVFVGVGLALYLFAVRLLAGRYFGLALLAALPPVMMSLRTGQNGCLTAALIGFVCCFLLRARPVWAGVPLGLMVIKPHIGVGLGIWLLFRRAWGGLAAAFVTVIVAGAAATAAFGPSIWAAFLSATGEASSYLSDARYPTFRLTSLYAALTSFGAAPSLAVLLHLAAAVLAVLAIVFSALRFETRAGLAATLFLTVLLSPYLYDYDVAILGPAFALLLPLADRDGVRLAVLPMIGLAWIVGGTGLVQNVRGAAANAVVPVSPAGFAAVVLAVLVLWTVFRFRRRPAAG